MKLLGSATICILLLALPARAETVAGAWQRAIGPWAWMFPRDHGAHPGFKTEWWYFTGNLEDERKRRFGYQLTIFRQGIQLVPAQPESCWSVRDFYFGHFAVSDIGNDRFHSEEKVSRGALGEAHATTGKMDVAIGPWTIGQAANEDIHIAAAEPAIGLDLTEHPAKPLVLEGVGGLSQKAEGPGEASYYYSYPRLATSGHLRIGDQTWAVSGLSWFDHEFSTSSLGRDQVGWDWFCLQLDDREEIMLYLMRDRSGAVDAHSEGTWVNADGTSQRLAPGSFSVKKTGSWRSSVSGALYPAGWRIAIPGHSAELEFVPAMADQELHLTKMGTLDYWEGACSAQGSVAGKKVTGVGYTELTGYAGSLQAGLKE